MLVRPVLYKVKLRTTGWMGDSGCFSKYVSASKASLVSPMLIPFSELKNHGSGGGACGAICFFTLPFTLSLQRLHMGLVGSSQSASSTKMNPFCRKWNASPSPGLASAGFFSSFKSKRKRKRKKKKKKKKKKRSTSKTIYTNSRSTAPGGI